MQTVAGPGLNSIFILMNFLFGESDFVCFEFSVNSSFRSGARHVIV